MKTINTNTLKNAPRRLGYYSVAGMFLGMTIGLGPAFGNPTDPIVISGSASFGSTGSVLEVQNSPGTIIDWRDFSIGQDEITRFVQESSNSAILNRVTGGNLSHILGQLQSNGRVFLINPNGLVIGENAEIDAAGFVASTLDIDNQDFRDQNFSFNGSGGSIENRGLIHVRRNGELALIASSIENSGVLRSDGGDILLAAGNSITLSFENLDNLTFDVQAPDNEVVNLGQIIAGAGNASLRGGRIINSGQVVVENADGRIFLQASDLAQVSGELVANGGDIHIEARQVEVRDAVIDTSSNSVAGNVALLGDNVGLFSGATVKANGSIKGGEVLIGGEQQGQGDTRTSEFVYLDENASVESNGDLDGDGGRIILFAENTARVNGQLSARGGTESGDGGFIETSGLLGLEINKVPDAGATNGQAGTWLIDPINVTIDVGTQIGVTQGPVGPNEVFTPNTIGAFIDVALLEAALLTSNVLVDTTGTVGGEAGDITVLSSILSAVPGVGNGFNPESTNTLTLNSAADVLFGTFGAQTPIVIGAPLVVNAVGNIVFDAPTEIVGSATLDSSAGSILVNELTYSHRELSATAANDILIASWFIGFNSTTVNAGSLLALDVTVDPADPNNPTEVTALDLQASLVGRDTSLFVPLTSRIAGGAQFSYTSGTDIIISGVSPISTSVPLVFNSELTTIEVFVFASGPGLLSVNSTGLAVNAAAGGGYDIDNAPFLGSLLELYGDPFSGANLQVPIDLALLPNLQSLLLSFVELTFEPGTPGLMLSDTTLRDGSLIDITGQTGVFNLGHLTVIDGGALAGGDFEINGGLINLDFGFTPAPLTVDGNLTNTGSLVIDANHSIQFQPTSIFTNGTTGTILLNDGTSIVGGLQLNNMGVIDVLGTGINIAAPIDNTGFFSVPVGTSASIDSIDVSGLNSELVIDGDLISTGNVNVLTDGLLSGIGSLTTTAGALLVQAGGILNPGASPGILTVNGDVSLFDGAIVDIELEGQNPGQFDVIDVQGSLSLGGAGVNPAPAPGVVINVINPGGLYTPDPTFSHQIFTATGGITTSAQPFNETVSGFGSLNLVIGSNSIGAEVDVLAPPPPPPPETPPTPAPVPAPTPEPIPVVDPIVDAQERIRDQQASDIINDVLAFDPKVNRVASSQSRSDGENSNTKRSAQNSDLNEDQDSAPIRTFKTMCR